jgi:SAM-dependent methyltransferase
VKVNVATIVATLRQGQLVPDPVFDVIYPADQRERSMVHWTPVEVAVRACALLAPYAGAKILDVGAGVGKLCLVGALTTRATWFGIETDVRMVEVAEAAAARLGVQEATVFGHGDAATLDWSAFDAFYLFNPFAERLIYGRHAIRLRRADYDQYIDITQQRLAAAAPGTRVVTYHGFGGEMPDGYDLVHREPAHEDELQLWIRRPSRRVRAEAAA